MFLGYARGAGNLKPDRQPWLSSLLNRRRSHTGEPHNLIDGGSADSSSDPGIHKAQFSAVVPSPRSVDAAIVGVAVCLPGLAMSL
jgi:hypothetical protein